MQSDQNQLAFDSSSTSLHSCALPNVKDFDEIESFLSSSDTFLGMQTSDILQLSQSVDDLDSAAEKVKIYVTGIPKRIKGSLLMSLFSDLGYSDIVRIDGPKYKVNIIINE
jgi:hypothetical protein